MTPTRDNARLMGPGAVVSNALAGGAYVPDSTTCPASTQNVTLYSDGLCEPNPRGWACWGWLALGADGQPVASDCGAIGNGAGMTNNLAEYTAVIQTLEWASGAGLVGLTLRTDSQLVVNQMTGAWQCYAPNLWPLLVKARALMAETGARVEWVPREQNSQADALSRKAYALARNGGRL